MAKGDDKKLVADIDDGYLKVAFLLAEALSRIRLPGSEHQVIWFIMRRTYGWTLSNDRSSGKTDIMTASEISLGTDLSKRNVRSCIAELSSKNIIISVKIKSNNLMAYGINPNIETWCPGDTNWDSQKAKIMALKDAGIYAKNTVQTMTSEMAYHDTTDGIAIIQKVVEHDMPAVIGMTSEMAGLTCVSPYIPRPDEVPTESLTEITTNNIESTVVDSPQDVETTDVPMVENEVELEFKSPPEKPAKKKRAKAKPKEPAEPKEEAADQKAIRHAYETLLNAPLSVDGTGYGGLRGLIQTYGIPIVYEWVAAVGKLTVAEGAVPWKFFCKEFRDALTNSWKWKKQQKQNSKPFSLVNNSFLGYEENWEDVETNYYGKDITGDYDE